MIIKRPRYIFVAGRDMYRGPQSWSLHLALGMHPELAKPYMETPAVFRFSFTAQRVPFIIKIDRARYVRLGLPFRFYVVWWFDWKLLRVRRPPSIDEPSEVPDWGRA